MTFSTAVFGPEVVAAAACRELSSVTVFWGNVCADTVVVSSVSLPSVRVG